MFTQRSIGTSIAVLDLGCKKGFLLKDLNILIPGIKTYGIENHPYALKKAVNIVKKNIEENNAV